MADTRRIPAPDPASTLPHSGRSMYLAYGCAILSTVLALLLRIALTPYIGAQFPYATVYFAVTLTAWLGGFRPAMVATVLGFLGAAYFIIPPYHSLALYGLTDYIGTGIYFFISISSAIFSEAQHKAQARAESSALEARLQEAIVRESEARNSAILETALDAIITMDHEGRITEFNPAAERMFGFHRAEALGKELAELIIPSAMRERHRKGLAHCLATGEGPVLGKRIEMMALRAESTEFPVELAIARISGEGPPMFSGHIHDITERRKSETRQRFLAEASNLLAASLDYQTTLQSVAHLAVPHLADWCAVDMPAEDGTMCRAAVSHIDPAKIELAHQLDRRYPPNPNAAIGAAEVMRTGKPEMVADMPDEILRAGTQDEQHYQIIKALGLKSYICVPLAARGRNLGAITFIGAESGHRYGPDDLALAEELARRAAIAVDNALLFQAERERSEQLTLAIQEVHHRVKNNLQAVSALLEMQIDPDSAVMPVEAVQDSLRQIKTIALVHDLLTHDQPIGNVDATQVLAKLIAMLSATLGAQENPVHIYLDAVPLQIPIRAATALALVINELVNNAAKHSLPSSTMDSSRHEASIQITLQQQQEEIHVSVFDNGPGFPAGFDPIRNANIGLELVQTLVSNDLQGSISFLNGANSNGTGARPDERGARVEITFSPAVLCD
jgi:PAS domain S-box-containing protein